MRRWILSGSTAATVLQSVTYKLNNVYNAGSLPRDRLFSLSYVTDIYDSYVTNLRAHVSPISVIRS